MNVIVVADGHYMQTPDGDVYADAVYGYKFYKRYLNVFDKVFAIVRLEKVEKIPENAKLSSGPNVEFLPLPPYTGPYEYFLSYFKIKKSIAEYSTVAPCAIFRIPGASSNLACKVFAKTSKPFAAEVVVDPWEKFAPDANDSIVAPIVRYSWTSFLKKMCKKANGVSYVTERYLQKKYPPHENDESHFTSYYSSVDLPDDSFAIPKVYEQKEKFLIVHVAASFTDNAKGHVPLIYALKTLRERGYDIEVNFIGDGPKRKEFEKLAAELQIIEYVHFLGLLPDGDAVKKEIRKGDLFVFPTRAEGLPRVLLEAMSEGLPCLSCATCGIPEILDSEYLYRYDDVDGWVKGIISFITNPKRMSDESARNLRVAHEYKTTLLEKRRIEFYRKLLEVSNVNKSK